MYAALDDSVTYRIEAGSLTLTGPEGHGLMLRALD
jgi:hypothetical protein